ncbi:MAG: cyclase family protein [Gemmatimonadota bacterium]|nr:cyclase family protein [Gemmatimonadota bacterium]
MTHLPSIKEIFDISVLLGVEEAAYPGDPEYHREVVCSLAEGDPFQLSGLRMSAHSGTHIDLPAHFIPGSETVDKFAVEKFILPAQVIRAGDTGAVERDELEKMVIKKRRALLFKTPNSTKNLVCSGTYSSNYTWLTPDAASLCIEREAPLVGIDYYSVDRHGDLEFPVHRMLLGNRVPILEGINLAKAPEGEYTLVCLPLKLKGVEASPVRAVLVR